MPPQSPYHLSIHMQFKPVFGGDVLRVQVLAGTAGQHNDHGMRGASVLCRGHLQKAMRPQPILWDAVHLQLGVSAWT